jgi:two-component system sensor histidine kinase KdpD
VVIYISDDPSTAMLIRRGKRVADILGSNCFAVCVAEQGDLQNPSSAKRHAVDRHLNFARNLHIETRVLIGKDQARAIVDFARLHGARQIFIPRIIARGIERLRRRSLVNEVVSLAKDMEVTIVADRRKTGNSSARAVR